MRRKQFQGYSTEKNCLSKIMEYGQARRNEKNSGGGGWGPINYVLLSTTMVGQRRKFFISNRLMRLEKLNIYRRQVM